MSNPTFFVQECPICGRRLQIRVEYLGRSVVCQHCQGRLVAADPSNRGCESSEAVSLVRRADELLASISKRNSQPR